MTENEEKFLEELTALSNKYKVAIAGCGCCGSPFIMTTDVENGYYKHYDGEDLRFEVKEG